MATKYILQSGGVRNYPDKKRKFHQEVVGSLKNPQILICIFAQPREVWEQKYPNYCQSIKEDLNDDVQPVFTLAKPDRFEQDCASNDIIYMQGGDDHLIRFWLEKYDIPKIWSNKIVSGNSGSSYVLAKHFWTNDWRKCMDGLGVLPIKFTGHFKSNYAKGDPRGPIDYDAIYKELKDYGDKSLPVYALEEGDYIVIEQ